MSLLNLFCDWEWDKLVLILFFCLFYDVNANEDVTYPELSANCFQVYRFLNNLIVFWIKLLRKKL